MWAGTKGTTAGQPDDLARVEGPQLHLRIQACANASECLRCVGMFEDLGGLQIPRKGRFPDSTKGILLVTEIGTALGHSARAIFSMADDENLAPAQPGL